MNLVTRGVVGVFDTDVGQCVGIDLDGGAASSTFFTPTATTVGTSRALTAADHGQVLECTATITLTVPAGLPPYFRCTIIPSGTTSIAASGTLLNGAGTTLTRAAATAANALVTIQARASVANSYVVTGS